MKKNTKMAANAKKRMEKEKELERLSNKELIIFTIGLIAEVVLLFFYSALKSTVAVKAGWVLVGFAGAFLAGFIALLVAGTMSAKKGGSEKKVKSLKNWSFCSLAFSIGALLMSAGRIVEACASAFGWDISTNILRYFVSGNPLQPRQMAIYLIVAVAVYVIASMIYFAVKSNKIKKS